MPHDTHLLRFPRKAISIVVLATLWFVGCCSLTWGDEEPLPEILILNSYHQGEDWSDNELAGILSTLKERYPFLVPSVEHLDTKRFSKPEHLAFLRQYLHNKYRGKRFDLIFVLDNPALDLMTSARHELFPGVPVVLAGINGYTPEMIRGQAQIAGVAEVQDMAGTLQLALTLHPGTKSVLVVHDYTASGLAVRRDMAAVADQFNNKVNIAYTPDGTVEELVAQLQSLPADALVLLLTYVTDTSGKSLTRTESTRLITNASPVPVYAMHETRLGHGIIGGMLLEGKEHGRQAAEIALRILAGKGKTSYGVENSQSRPVFDYLQLARFKVDLKTLPENSTLINRPVSFFQQHRMLLIPGFIVAVLLLAIIAILAISVSRIRTTRNELARSEEKYRGLFATILDGLILVDPTSRSFIEVNPAICSMTGYTSEEMRSLRVEDMHPEASLPYVLAQIAKRTNGEIPLAPGLSVKRKNGEVFYADVHAIPIQIQGRQLFLGVFRNTTERKLAEDLLRESEQRHREYLLNAPYAVFVTNAQGCYQQVNPAACRLTGYTEPELLAMSIADILAEDALENGLRHFQKVVQAGESRGEHCCRTKSGERRWWLITARKISDARILGFCEDITERKQFEAALLESEARIRAITESANDAIVMMDQSGHVSYWNPAAERIFGYKAEEVLGIDLHHLIAPKRYHAAFNAAFPTFQQTGEGAALNAPLELEARHKNGHEISVELSLSALQHHDGWHTVGIVRDITERKQAEEERKQLLTQLVQAQKMEAIGTLAGGIAHDFNNILGAILGYTEIAIDSIAPDSMAINYLDKVMEASRRAAGLVKQILAFSRQAATERVALQPAQLVREVIKLLRPSLPSTITIRAQIDSATKTILADPTQLHQILMNLSTNAYHAMEQTGGTLEITLKDCELSPQDLRQHLGVQPGGFVQLSIGDSGQGIAPEIRDKIFEPYFTTKEVGKGTGMGLAIVHGIVTGYGGFITCESAPGGGTVFHVFFPSIEEEAGLLVEPVEAMLSGGARILLVDDEEILVELGTTMLEHLGCEVTARTSSLEALDLFQHQPDRFDAVITDQTMPGMTGMELARRMLDIRPELPIILCTGYSSLVTEEQAKTNGIQGFALKPLTKREIARHLSAVLNREEVADA